jgi:hypothetical protein
MVENEGDRTACPTTICRGIYWHNPSQHDIFASQSSHSNTSPAEWDPVQELLPASPSLKNLLRKRIGGYGKEDIDSCPHGAVIFGRAKSSKFTWPDVFGGPVIAGPDDAEDSQVQPLGSSSPSHDSSSADSGRAYTTSTASGTQVTNLTSPLCSRLSAAGNSGSVSGSGSQQGSLGSTRMAEAAESVTEVETDGDLGPTQRRGSLSLRR